jgi:hypothetical protein
MVNYKLVNNYDKLRKRSVATLRCIGKVNEVNGLLVTNRNYFMYVPESRIYLTEEVISYYKFKEDELYCESNSLSVKKLFSDKDETQTIIEDGRFILHFGDYMFINEVCKSLRLTKCLESSLGLDRAHQIIDVARYSIIKGYNVMKDIKLFFESSVTKSGRRLYDTDISKLFKSLGVVEQTDFYKLWRLALSTEGYWVIDVSSIFSYVDDRSRSQYGYNRDNEPLPQTNYILLFGVPSNLPYYAESYDGSIPDEKFLRCFIEHLIGLKYDISKIELLLDREFPTKENIDLLLELDIKFLICIDMKESKTKEAISEYHKLKDMDFNIASGISAEYYSASIPCKDNSKTKYLLYCNDMVKKADIRKFKDNLNELEGLVFDNKITTLKQEKQLKRFFIWKRITILEEDFLIKNQINQLTQTNIPLYSDYLDMIAKYEKALMTKKDKLVCVKVDTLYDHDGQLTQNNEEIQKEFDTFGMFGFITNTLTTTTQEGINKYDRRCLVEQEFDTFKNSQGMKRQRTKSFETDKGKQFCFTIELIIVSQIRNLIADYNKRYKGLSKTMQAKIPNFQTLTPSGLLNELQNIHLTGVYGKTQINQLLSKRQRFMLDLVGIDGPKIFEYIRTT